MKANLKFDNCFFEISELIGRIPQNIEVNEKEALKEMAIVVKKNVENRLDRSDVGDETKNYDSTRPYKHMKDDVKYSVSKSRDGELYAKIQGGKYTGYKWRFLNDGTVKNGKIHTRATHFIDHALSESENETNDIVDRLIKESI